MTVYFFCSEPIVEIMERIVKHKGRASFLDNEVDNAPWASYVAYPYGKGGFEADAEMQERGT